MKRIILSLSVIFFITTNVFAAGSSNDGDSSAKKTNYEKAVSHINSAKKHEKKGNLEKAKQSYAKAQKLLIKSNKRPIGLLFHSSS